MERRKTETAIFYRYCCQLVLEMVNRRVSMLVALWGTHCLASGVEWSEHACCSVRHSLSSLGCRVE